MIFPEVVSSPPPIAFFMAFIALLQEPASALDESARSSIIAAAGRFLGEPVENQPSKLVIIAFALSSSANARLMHDMCC